MANDEHDARYYQRLSCIMVQINATRIFPVMPRELGFAVEIALGPIWPEPAVPIRWRIRYQEQRLGHTGLAATLAEMETAVRAELAGKARELGAIATAVSFSVPETERCALEGLVQIGQRAWRQPISPALSRRVRSLSAELAHREEPAGRR